MLRISLPWILEVVASIDRLQQIKAGTNKRESAYLCHGAKNDIQNIFDQSIYASYLKISRQKANALVNILDQAYNQDSGENDQVFSDFESWWINRGRTEFREVFFAELSVLPAFLVTGKEAYDTNTLTDEGYKLTQVAPYRVPTSLR